MNLLNIGVIGFGYWGPNLVRNFSAVPDARVHSVADLDERRLALVKTRYPAIEVTTDFQTLLTSPDIDAVTIATPVSSHYDLTPQALVRGKHVFVEKPITEPAEQAERLVAEAEKHGFILHVDHTFIHTTALCARCAS
jgi:predicted dehydrogenase